MAGKVGAVGAPAPKPSGTFTVPVKSTTHHGPVQITI